MLEFVVELVPSAGQFVVAPVVVVVVPPIALAGQAVESEATSVQNDAVPIPAQRLTVILQPFQQISEEPSLAELLQIMNPVAYSVRFSSDLIVTLPAAFSPLLVAAALLQSWLVTSCALPHLHLATVVEERVIDLEDQLLVDLFQQEIVPAEVMT